MKLRIRVDSDRMDDAFVQFLSPYKSYVLVYHILPHGNSHYHAYVEDTMSLSIDAIRKRIDRQFNVKGPDRSVKKCDDDKIKEYVQYLFNKKHGNLPTLVSVRDFDVSLLLQLQTQAQDVADDFTQRQKIKSDKKQVSQYDLAEQVKERLETTHKELYTIEDYTRAAIQVMRTNRKAFCKFSLGRIIMTAMKDEEIITQMQNYFHEI